MSGDERSYWSAMQYACEDCHAMIWFYLEDGCEGPRSTVEQPDNLASRRADPTNWTTPSGRRIVPVPFVATRCPDCGKPMTHVNWRGDQVFDPPIPADHVPDNVRLFHYPRPPLTEGSCGVAAESAMDRRLGILLR